LKVFTDIDAITSIPHPVLTIGTFDGVHLGHQQIIQQLNREASKIEGESVLFTFYPHPRMVVYPETHGLKLLQTQEEKLEKLERMGLQNVIVYPFNFEFSRLSATEFIRDYLVKKLQVKKLVIGYDHQFGRNREGTIDFLKTISEIYEFDVIEIPPEEIDAINISSTKIRDSLLEGKVDNAALFLGEPFCLQGKVIKGDQLGRTIGFPTANIALNAAEKIIPANGVYAVTAKINGRLYTGMMNIGRRPTIKGIENDLRLEVHLFDFSDTL
jgi:riboflavin kinase/FMN adenylyltransferase